MKEAAAALKAIDLHPRTRGARLLAENKIGAVPITELWAFSAPGSKDKPGGLVSVYWSFSSGDFDALAVTLTEKFGEPHKREEHAVQNRMGAKFTNKTMRWRGPTVGVVLTRYGSKLTQGAAFFALNEVLRKFDEESEATQKGAKDAF